MSRPDGFDPNRMLGHKFRLASVGIDKYCRRRGEEHGDDVPRGQGSFLSYMIHHEDQTIYQKDLERVFHITGATASNMLKSLEKTGMIERIPSEEDARLKKIVVTEKARSREQQIHEDILFLEQNMLNGFTEEEKTQVFDMLGRIVHNIWDLCEDTEKKSEEGEK